MNNGPTHSLPTYLTVQEVAGILRTSARVIRRHEKALGLTARKVGRTRIYDARQFQDRPAPRADEAADWLSARVQHYRDLIAKRTPSQGRK